MDMRRLGILAAMASIALIAACGSNDDDGTTAVPEGDSSSAEETAEPAIPLTGSRWVLTSVETAGASVQGMDDPEAYFQIDEKGEVSGSTGCNGFGGSAEVGDDVITFEPLIATKKACSGELGQIDSAMLGVLRGDVTTEVVGEEITLTNADGDSLTMHASAEPASG